MTDPQQMGSSLSATNDAMQGIINASNKGQFQVTPEAGDELIKLFKDVEDWATDAQYDLDFLKQDTPLGESPAGQAISTFNQQVAAGDSDSYEAMVKQIRERAPQVVEALKKGIALYQETDEGNASQFGRQA